jgi:DUF1009 family protein
MSALAQSSIEKIGIIAGGGALPERLLAACDRDGYDAFIVAFEGQTNPTILQGRKHLLTRLGAAGRIINTLKSNGIKDLVFIGSIRRPSLTEMRPDFRAMKFFTRLATRALGDNGLLTAMKRELEHEGFRLHGAHCFMQDLLAPAGPVGGCEPDARDHDDIARGLNALRVMGGLDIGQGLVVQEGIILGVEAAEGTDEMIRRCGLLKRRGRGPILVKISKPGQDLDLDMPTIGPDTIITARDSGFCGIVVEAGSTLILDPGRVAEIADAAGMFVFGVQ